MDSLKIVPQLFFDLIGRTVPGCVGILMYILMFGSAEWKLILQGIDASEEGLDLGFALLAFLLLGYAIGHLLSPATKLVEAIGTRLAPMARKPNAADYEWLRMYFPGAGGVCAKLRAEFAMYNGLAAVFSLCFLAAVAARPLGWKINGMAGGASAMAAFALLAAAMTYRGRETRATFANSVRLFREAANHPPGPCIRQLPAAEEAA